MTVSMTRDGGTGDWEAARAGDPHAFERLIGIGANCSSTLTGCWGALRTQTGACVLTAAGSANLER